MAKKIDFQQILLQHGERIGLGAAGAVALLLLLTSLFLPGHGMFAGSPADKAKVLNDVSSNVDQLLRSPTNVPSDADKPPKEADKQLIAYKNETVSPHDFAMMKLGSDHSPSGTLGRRVPKIYPVAEALADAARLNLRSYIIHGEDPPRIVVLKGEGGAAAGPGSAPGRPGRAPGMNPFGRGGFPGLGGMGGMGGRGMMGGRGGLFRPPGMLSEDDGVKEKKPQAVELDKLKDESNVTLAEQPRPVTLAVVVASFPYKKQIEEFRSRLGLRTDEEVLTEPSLQKSKDGVQPPAFRFQGAKLQRRELNGDGKPVTDWTDVDLQGDYRPYVVLTGKRVEADDTKLTQVISVPGAPPVMPKLQQFVFQVKPKEANAGGPGMPGGGIRPPAAATGSGVRSGPPGMPGGPGASGAPATPVDPEKDEYPQVEKKLRLLAEALDELKEKGPTLSTLPPSKFRTDDFDVFGGGNPSANDPTGRGPGMTGPGSAVTGPPGMGPDATGGGTGLEIPKYCLVRLIDVSVMPGKTYQYRIQMVMTNPNFGRTDVASPDYAKKPTLESDWFEVPTPVSIQPDLYYYAVDEKDLHEGGRYKGPAWSNEELRKDKYVFMQAHRWLNTVKLAAGGDLTIGDWAVAERFPVHRGEYVGRSVRVEVPYWRYTRENFVVATEPNASKKRQGIYVPFGYQGTNTNQPEAILVDFESGRTGVNRVVSRNDDNMETRSVTDARAAEALLLNPDGKLVLLEGANDARDVNRTNRLDKVKNRLKEVREGGKTSEAGGEKGPRFSN